MTIRRGAAERRLVMLGAAVVLGAPAGRTCSSKAPPDDLTGRPALLVDDMRPVPAGCFSTGCYRLLAAPGTHGDKVDDADMQRMRECVEADPSRRLWPSSFEIDRFEVTVGEYQQCLDAHAASGRSRETWSPSRARVRSTHAPGERHLRSASGSVATSLSRACRAFHPGPAT